MNIAYFSPLNPLRSGISDYSEELLPALARRTNVELFVDGYTPANPAIAARFPYHDVDKYPRRRWEYDMALFHIGNHICHEAIVRTFMHYPGVAVMHEYMLQGLVLQMTLGRGDVPGYLREVAYALGKDGLSMARRHIPIPDTEPLNQRLLDLGLGFIVHSDYARRQLLRSRPGLRVCRLPMPFRPESASPLTQPQARAHLGMDEDAFTVGVFGFLNTCKRVESVLEAFHHLCSRVPQAQLFFVGESLQNQNNPVTIAQRLGLEEKVRFTGFVPFADFGHYIAAIDVAVNLRHPTFGEASASALRAMGAGRPTIVSDAGWFAELPDDCVLKVSGEENEVEALAAHLWQLAQDEALRRDLGRRARDHVLAHHRVDQVAQQYVVFMQKVLASPRCASQRRKDGSDISHQPVH
jgi:glycosyltransferase involved in cell wall biosynthesis